MANLGAAGQGAVAGAGAGAALGPWGAVAGGAIGGLLGLFSPDKEAEAMRILAGLDPEAGAMAAEDPAARAKIMGALEYLYNSGQAGGMDPQSRAALAQAQAQTGAAEQGARGALQQNAAARGVGGSGVEFLGTLANQQGAAQRNALSGVQAAGDARTRALQSMYQASSGYGDVRGQDLSRESAKKQLDMFNANQRVKKAAMMTGQYNGQADQQRNDIAGMGEGIGALTSYFKSGSK